MKKFLKIKILALVLFLGLGLVGCNTNSIDDKVIKIAASEIPHAEILEQIRPYVESFGYDLEIIVFNDYIIPNQVTQNNEVDANFFQHEPYLLDFNKNNKTNLVSVLQVHFEPLGLYQGKRQALDNLERAKIAIANDTSNGARGLLLLQEAGIIKLDPNKGTNVSKSDIIENKYNVDIIELDAAIIPAQLKDLDFAVINGNYSLEANISRSKILFSESRESLGALLYSNIIAVKAEYIDKEAVRILVDALSQPNISEFIYKTYDGVVVPIN